MLARGKPQPGSKVSTTLKPAKFRRKRFDRHRADRPYAWHGPQEPYDSTLLAEIFDLLRHLVDQG